MSGLIIRADATRAIGSGHVMRCLALAESWMCRGGEVTLSGVIEADALRARAHEAGIRVVDTPCSHPDPRDLDCTTALIADTGAAAGTPLWVVLDGYHFDSAYQRALRLAGCRLLVVDDTHHLPSYHADLLLNQNLGAERIAYVADPDTQLLLGSRYALLRGEFEAQRPAERAAPPIARRVLITMGGADPDNVTCRAINALDRANIPGIEATVLVGALNPHAAALSVAASSAGSRVTLVHDAPNLPSIMSRCDMAISGAGSTCWELACMGVPTITVVLAENQRGIAEALAAAGAAVNAGWFHTVEIDGLANHIADLAADPAHRARLSAVARSLIDRRGASRVVDVMMSLTGGLCRCDCC
jgi:UDP-2,4-diacetamido-2,4,6-trideoxy-beta-L-altropyranose hydrolase